MSALQEHLSKQENKFNNWEENYIRELQGFKHDDEEEKKANKKDYPKQGEQPKGKGVNEDNKHFSESEEGSERSDSSGDDEENDDEEDQSNE